MRQGSLLENVTVLLQNATVIRKCEVYYKMRQVSLLENATVLLQNATVITKCVGTTFNFEVSNKNIKKRFNLSKFK